MEDPRTLIAILLVLVYALASARLNRWWISMPMVMVLFGFALGPNGLGAWQVDVRSQLVKTIAELTLALMLFHDAVRIDLRALRASLRIPLRLLGIGLPLMIVFGTVVAWRMFPVLGLAAAALLATMLAPTDAALGDAVVSDTRVPMSVRQGLNVESGLNDGLSVPVFLVLLAICAEPGGAQPGALVSELVRQIGLGLLGGALVGGLGGLLFRIAGSGKTMLDSWRRIAILFIAVGCFVAAAILGGSGFIGAFAGGVIFGLASEARSTEDNALTEQVGAVFDALSFLLVGAVLIPLALQRMSWEVVAYAIVSLAVIRMGSVVVALIRSGARWQTQAFIGWFGPRGLATVVFTVLLLEAAVPNGDLIAAVVITGIVLSVFAHGLTAPPFVAAYARWWNAVGGQGLESQIVHEHRTRRAAARSGSGT